MNKKSKYHEIQEDLYIEDMDLMDDGEEYQYESIAEWETEEEDRISPVHTEREDRAARTERMIRRKEREKAKIRRKRRKTVKLQRAALIIGVLVVVAGGGFAVYWNLPGVKLDREISHGQEYTEAAAYDQAIASYEQALELDKTSVKAYRYMAGTYLNMDDTSSAKKVLYQGWEATEDDGLLNYYCTVLLNEAVEQINAQSCDMGTVEKCVEALEKDAANEDALGLLDTLYARIFSENGEEAGQLFVDTDAVGESCAFPAYRDILSRLGAIAAQTDSEPVRQMLVRYAMPGTEVLTMSQKHMEEYHTLLDEITAASPDAGLTELSACLTKAVEIQQMFAGLFPEFEAGNYEASREFIVSESYLDLRDQFIEGSMEYWDGATYIPVSRELVNLYQSEEGKWKFSFPDYEDNPSGSGVITVWGGRLLDNGHQRTCISFEPAGDPEKYYPHTEYVMMYNYSNVKIKGAYVPQMNYRFETKRNDGEEVTTDVIGDWGGEHEWESSY